MYAVNGEFFIDLKCGGYPVTLVPALVTKFVITQEMGRLLPTFAASFADSGGVYTHQTPSDQSISQWSVDIGLQLDNYLNSFAFDVYRRAAEGEVVSSSMYNLSGIATVKGNALCCDYNRSFSGTVASTLMRLAREVGADKFDISPSLMYPLSIVQPGWTTPRLLSYLQKHLTGSGGQVGYVCFMKHLRRNRVFVFKTYEELFAQPAVQTYYCGNVGSADTVRLYSYGIKENPLLSKLAPSAQRYTYFDWESGAYVETTLAFRGKSLSDNLGYDSSEELGNVLNAQGRTNALDQKFLGTVGTQHYKRAYNLVSMWVTVPGNPSLCPGDCVKLVFGANQSDLFQTQYSGFWLVEKVAHNFGNRYVTYMRLTRNGYDQAFTKSTLKAALNRKRT